VNLKTPFLSKPFISLRQDSINGGKVYLEVIVFGFIRLLLININISVMFCYDFVGSHYVCFDLWGGIVATGSLVSSLVSSLFGSSVGSLVGFLVGSSGLGYRYSFTTIVLKSVGPLRSYILYISPLIPSSLNRPVYLPLYLVLPSRYTSTSELRRRLWIVVTDGLFCWFSALLTYFFALILAISSIAFFIATACCVMDSVSNSQLSCEFKKNS